MYGFNDFINTFDIIPKTLASPFILSQPTQQPIQQPAPTIAVPIIQPPNFSNDPLSDVTYRPPLEAITITPTPINNTITNQEFTTSNIYNSTTNSSNVSNNVSNNTSNNTSNTFTTINQFDPSQLLQTTTTLSNLISQSNSTLDAKFSNVLNASTNKLNSDFSNLSSKVDTNTTATFNKLADTTASLDKINNSNIKLTNELLNFQNQTTQNNKSLNDMFNTQMKISEKNLNIIETQNKNILDLSEKLIENKSTIAALSNRSNASFSSQAFVGPTRESSAGGILLLLPLLFLIK